MHAELETLWFFIIGLTILNTVWFFGFIFVFSILKLDQITYNQKTEDYKVEKTKPRKNKPLTLVKKP